MYSRAVVVWAFVVIPCVMTGCRAEEIQSAYSYEFKCPEDKVTVEELGTQRYRVTGCDRSLIYQCLGDACAPVRNETPTREPEVSASAQRPQPEVAKRERRNGQTLVALDLRLDKRVSLKLRAAPDEYGELVQLKLSRIEAVPSLEDCELGWMVNGQRLEAPAATHGRDGTLSILKSDLPREIVRELGAAQQFAMRACDWRWSLQPSQLAEIRHFVQLYEEDVAWSGPAAKGTGGLLAPAGGWARWKVESPGKPADSKGGRTLDTRELFKLLSPSVFRVEAELTAGTSQGSAVAVGKTEVVTNCHVIEGAQKIVLKQEKKQWAAELARSDPGSDRCVLTASNAAFTPVLGFRAYEDLEVGEPLFTLGSPSGLELSLSNGILSGLRTEGGRRFVQTTAPISPGSSGGGLFDAHGYIVGVTTLVLVGREHLNQSLNFAIPADSFFRP